MVELHNDDSFVGMEEGSFVRKRDLPVKKSIFYSVLCQKYCFIIKYLVRDHVHEVEKYRN